MTVAAAMRSAIQACLQERVRHGEARVSELKDAVREGLADYLTVDRLADFDVSSLIAVRPLLRPQVGRKQLLIAHTKRLLQTACSDLAARSSYAEDLVGDCDVLRSRRERQGRPELVPLFPKQGGEPTTKSDRGEGTDPLVAVARSDRMQVDAQNVLQAVRVNCGLSQRDGSALWILEQEILSKT